MTAPQAADLSKLRINRDDPPPAVKRAVLMGVIGGFFPALRAVRLQVVQALR